MATSSLSAYTGSIANYSTNLNRNHQWENEASLQSSLFFNSPLKTSTTAQFLNKQLTLSVSSTSRPLSIISMAPPKPGGKPRIGGKGDSGSARGASFGCERCYHCSFL